MGHGLFSSNWSHCALTILVPRKAATCGPEVMSGREENWGNRPVFRQPKIPFCRDRPIVSSNVFFALASGDPVWVWLLSWIWNKDTITWGGIGKDQILTPSHRLGDAWSNTTSCRRLWCNAVGKGEGVWLKGKGQCAFEIRTVADGTP